MVLVLFLHLLVRKIMVRFGQSHFDERFHHPNDLGQRDPNIGDDGQFRPILEYGFAAPELL